MSLSFHTVVKHCDIAHYLNLHVAPCVICSGDWCVCNGDHASSTAEGLNILCMSAGPIWFIGLLKSSVTLLIFYLNDSSVVGMGY